MCIKERKLTSCFRTLGWPSHFVEMKTLSKDRTQCEQWRCRWSVCAVTRSGLLIKHRRALPRPITAISFVCVFVSLSLCLQPPSPSPDLHPTHRSPLPHTHSGYSPPSVLLWWLNEILRCFQEIQNFDERKDIKLRKISKEKIFALEREFEISEICWNRLEVWILT